ncbi:Fur family transcriptional regulator [Candidatus Thiothrix sp. Deng01]|uniref:Fur family transcriptional regulator n=1 Tax=Candidatus Thiothrix phosphatis TaxID=3112415 RepID=A0ABU6D012_9GAMM|nr:Fur family transcriptional regulator [Candidatus Thiothrix sp. Deng01]MEB4591648.1 Fur family transcriptional regulator [Candidatus Thiothrix sp. Deng01]
MTPDVIEQDARELLYKAQGRVTPARLGVLGILLAAKSALSHQEIEQTAQQQGLSFDRVTLYRALDWLVEQGIAHKVGGVDRTWRYNALAGATHQHAHFHCKQCGQIFCLESLQPALLFSLPPGYRVEEVEVNLQGHCPACADPGTN